MWVFIFTIKKYIQKKKKKSTFTEFLIKTKEYF